MTLIQLISEQTIQNLLPILRLMPKRLVHLVTSRTAGRSDWLKSAALAAGIRPEVIPVELSSMPGIMECNKLVLKAISEAKFRQDEIMVNFTGGTKLMSIGAYAAALREKVPSLYVDTQDACFVDGGTSPEVQRILEGDLSFDPILKQMRVDVLGIANGVERVTGGERWEPLAPLANHLFENEREEEIVHELLYGAAGLLPKGQEPRKPQGWLELLDREFVLPARVAELALEAGLLKMGGESGSVRLPDDTRNELICLSETQVKDYFTRFASATSPMKRVLTFLGGGWWELVVCQAASRSGLFRDLRWSAHVGERNGPDTEEDVLGLDGVELLYISCKRMSTGSRLLPLLEEIRARASTIGGTFNRRFLAVRIGPHGRVAENLRKRAHELGIRIVTGANILEPGVLSRTHRGT